MHIALESAEGVADRAHGLWTENNQVLAPRRSPATTLLDRLAETKSCKTWRSELFDKRVLPSSNLTVAHISNVRPMSAHPPLYAVGGQA